MAIARASGVPVILWGHGHSKRPAWWRDTLRKLPIRLARALILYDQNTADRLISSGVPKEKVFVAKNGLDTERIRAARDSWTAVAADLAEFRRRNELGDERVLLFVGRLHERNRLDVVVRALATEEISRSGTKLAIIGAGDEERGLPKLTRAAMRGERAVDLGRGSVRRDANCPLDVNFQRIRLPIERRPLSHSRASTTGFRRWYLIRCPRTAPKWSPCAMG